MEMLFDFCVTFSLCIVGLVCHWAKKNYRRQTKADLLQYLQYQPWSTFRTICGLIIADCGALALITDIYTPQSFAVFILAGFAIDSGLNTTPEQGNKQNELQ